MLVAGVAISMIFLVAVDITFFGRGGSSSSSSSGLATSTSIGEHPSQSQASSSSLGSPSSGGALVITTVQPMFLSPWLSQTFTISFVAVGNLTGTFLLSALGLPASVSASFSPPSVALHPGTSSPVGYLTMTANKSTLPANENFTIQAASGSSVWRSSQLLRVVQYLVIIQGDTYTPASLTIRPGGTVFWVNWDALGGRTAVEPADLVSGGFHSIVADDGSFSSPILTLDSPVFSHTFSSAGQYSYHDGMAPSIPHGMVAATNE